MVPWGSEAPFDAEVIVVTNPPARYWAYPGAVMVGAAAPATC